MGTEKQHVRMVLQWKSDWLAQHPEEERHLELVELFRQVYPVSTRTPRKDGVSFFLEFDQVEDMGLLLEELLIDALQTLEIHSLEDVDTMLQRLDAQEVHLRDPERLSPRSDPL